MIYLLQHSPRMGFSQLYGLNQYAPDRSHQPNQQMRVNVAPGLCAGGDHFLPLQPLGHFQ
jgi:hypothetical protein